MSDIAVESQSPPMREEPAPWRKTVTTISVFSLLLLGFVAACNHDKEPERPTVDEVRGHSSTLNTIKEEQRNLRIAVWENVPYISFVDPKTKEFRGFDIDIARAIAADLGFREEMIQWVPLGDLPDRRSVLRDGRADMVVASFSMTADRLADVTFAGPYLVVPQAVLVPRDRITELDTIAELQAPGVTVCTTTGSTSAAVLEKRGIEYHPRDTNAECMAGMRSGEYDGFSTDRHILAAFDRQDEDNTGQDTFEVLDTAIADEDEKIGIAVPKDDAAMRTLVTHFLSCWKSKKDGGSPWRRAYHKWLGALVPDTFQPNVDAPEYPGVGTPPYLADQECVASQG